MKLSKIILTTLAAAAVIGLAGCRSDEDEHKMITIKGDTAIIEATNDTKDTWRGFKTLKTKHTDAVAVFTINPDDLVEEDGVRAGVLGFVFDLQEKDKLYNFSTVSVRLSGKNVQTYISRYEGVDPDKMDGGTNFKDSNGKVPSAEGATIKETAILKGSSGAYATISGLTTNIDGAYVVAVEVHANDNGTYAVTYYDGNDALKEGGKEEFAEDGSKIKTGQIKDGAKKLTVTGNASTPDGTCTVDASWKGATKTKQEKMGFYAATYAGCTMKGTIQLPYILNEDEVVEWED